ncbi:MAG: SPOR domain-containing protein [Thiolinea sp.]
MDNKSTTKRMIGAVVLVLIAALLLAWLLKGKNRSVQEQQELIAEQTQDATPILGFPGVKEGEEQTAAQEGEAPYVIGGADGQAQDTGVAQDGQTDQQQMADAGGAADEKSAAGGVADTAAGAVTAGKEAVQNLADSFKVRDDANGEQEQRQVVADGQAKAGTGSMGSSELSIPNQQQAGGADQKAADNGAADQNQTAQQAQGSQDAQQTQAAATDSAAKAQQAAGAGSNDKADGDATQKQAVANPKLVDEKPVPAPKAQSSASGSGTSAAAGSSASASSQSQQAATGGSGYAIQVLAASSRGTAEKVRQSIAVDGYPVFIVQANVNGKTVYRVRVGTYPARSAARDVQSKMKARYTQNQYVQNSFVTKN